MKILQVVHSFVPYAYAGTEIHTYELSKALCAQGHDVSVFFRVNRPRDKEYALWRKEFEGLHTYALNHTFNHCRSFQETYEDACINQAFGQVLDEIKPNIVHIQHLMFLSLGMVREAKKRNIPVTFTLHDYWLICQRCHLLKDDLSVCRDYNCSQCLSLQLGIRGKSIHIYNVLRKNINPLLARYTRKIYQTFARKMLASSPVAEDAIKKRQEMVQELVAYVDLFCAPSHFIREKFIPFGFPSEKIVFCRNGIEESANAPAARAQNGDLRFGYIGTLLPLKGIEILIEAFKEIKNPHITLHLYGKVMPYAGYEDYDKRIRKITADDHRIRLMGEFAHSDISSIFADIDVLVVPSLWEENSPLVIQEAYMHKTPVIASRIGGIPELFAGQESCLLCVPSDTEDLRKKLEQVINDREILTRMRLHTPEVKRMIMHSQEIEAFYQRLLN